MVKWIYDIGMHKGEDTAYYLARGYNVVGVEADAEFVMHCKQRFESAITAGQLVIHHGAIVADDTVSSVKFFKNTTNSVWGTASPDWAYRNEHCFNSPSNVIEVPVVKFADLALSQRRPCYVKIDIEGADRICLQKIAESDYRPDYISIESEKVSFLDLIKEFDMLSTMGYDRFMLSQQMLVSLQKIPPDTRMGPFVDYTFNVGESGLFGSDLGDKWLSKEEALRCYEQVFEDYILYGDRSPYRYDTEQIHKVSRARNLLYDLPGWYDTHAKHSSAID